MSSAALLFLSGSMAGKGSKLKDDVMILGRSSSCDITVKDASISREHVKIFKEDDVYILEDLNSNNGVKFEDEKVSRLELHTGMKFLIGKVELQFIDPTQVALVNGSEGIPSAGVAAGDEYNMMHDNIVDDAEEDLAKLNALKMKRLTNIVILCCIVFSLLLLGALVVRLLTQEDRVVHTKTIKMYTNEMLVVDLNFKPKGSHENLLSPFVVYDYNNIALAFSTLRVKTDIIIEEEVNNPYISNSMKIKTKNRTGGGTITFSIIEDEERIIIGILNIDVLRRPVPKIISIFAGADISDKEKRASEALLDYNKNKDNAEKLKANWKNLRDAKSIFIGGKDAKPDVYFKLEDAFYELTKIIERNTRGLMNKYDIAQKANQFEEMRRILIEVKSINPDAENIYRQKANIYIRRLNRRINR